MDGLLLVLQLLLQASQVLLTLLCLLRQPLLRTQHMQHVELCIRLALYDARYLAMLSKPSVQLLQKQPWPGLQYVRQGYEA